MSPNRIDLFQGWPSPETLPIGHLKQAATDALSNKAISADGLGYGPDEGYMPLRQNIARWLSGFYAPSQPIPADRVCITGGASQNLACILQVFTDAVYTQAVWLVEPAYHLVFRVFEDAGFHGRLRGIPEDEAGMDVGILEEALEAVDKSDGGNCQTGHPTKLPRPYRKIYKHVIYCVPTFSNPSGITMSRERREALVRLARKHDALIVSDDVYDFLHWNSSSNHPPENRLPRLVDIDRVLGNDPQDRFGHVISNGSFSKLIGPGCRVGWTEGTEGLVYGLSQAGSTRSGGAPSQLMSTIVNELFHADFLPRYITDTLIPEGRRRYTAIASAIRSRLGPLGVTFTPDPGHRHHAWTGGYYIWLGLPASLGASQVCREALRRQNLVLGNGELFAVPGGSWPVNNLHQRLRLCFMWENERQLLQGVERLEIVLRELLKEL